MNTGIDTNQLEGLFTVSFLDFARAARDLTPDSRLWSVLAIFKENARSYGLPSADIFQAVYDDPTGAEYWRGWIDIPEITVEEFVNMFSVHTASEFSETLDPQSSGYGRSIVEKYLANRDSLIIALKDAASAPDIANALKLEGNVEALSQLETYSDPALEWAQGKNYRLTKVLRNTRLNLKETLTWLADNTNRLLLPKSFIDWWKASQKG